MNKLILVATAIILSGTLSAQTSLKLDDSQPETILKSDFNKNYPINLFGDYKLRGSILTKNDFLFNNYSATGENVVREGYTATGFLALDGVAIQTQMGFKIGGKKGTNGFSTRSMLLNRPQQGFLQEGNILFMVGDGLKLNLLTPVR